MSHGRARGAPSATSWDARTYDRVRLRGLECLAGASMEWPDLLANAGALAQALGIGVLDADGADPGAGSGS